MASGLENVDPGLPAHGSTPAWARAGVFLFVVTALAGGVGVAVWKGRAFIEHGRAGHEGGGELPLLGAAPSFSLTDQDGRRFDSSFLAGKVWVGDFIFTSCGASCPVMTARMKEIQDCIVAAPALRDRSALVSFSVDPERDTAARLKEFAAHSGARAGLWWFLTGDAGAVPRLSREGFHLAAESPPPEPVDGRPPTDLASHSDRFVLVDRAGRLRGYYRPAGDGDEMARLLRDFRRLAEEPPGS